MLNSKLFRAVIFSFVFLSHSPALFASAASGFELERLYLSAPAPLVRMDELNMHGGLGGAVNLTTGFAHDPLVVQNLAVVSTEASADVGLAATYERFKVYLNFTNPISITGNSGSVGNYDYTAPSVGWGNQPDTLSDIRLGFDVRFLGDAQSPFRMGGSSQVFVPSGTVPGGNRADYDTDGSVRTIERLLVAGDASRFTYAGQLGVHTRPLNDYPTPGSPRGSELLLGIAGGFRIQAFTLGVELYEATAFQAFMAAGATAREALASGRFESLTADGRMLRIKLGAGAGSPCIWCPGMAHCSRDRADEASSEEK